MKFAFFTFYTPTTKWGMVFFVASHVFLVVCHVLWFVYFAHAMCYIKKPRDRMIWFSIFVFLDILGVPLYYFFAYRSLDKEKRICAIIKRLFRKKRRKLAGEKGVSLFFYVPLLVALLVYACYVLFYKIWHY